MIEQGDKVRLATDTIDDGGTLHRQGDPGYVVGFMGLTHAIVVFTDSEYATVPLEDLITERRSK